MLSLLALTPLLLLGTLSALTSVNSSHVNILITAKSTRNKINNGSSD